MVAGILGMAAAVVVVDRAGAGASDAAEVPVVAVDLEKEAPSLDLPDLDLP